MAERAGGCFGAVYYVIIAVDGEYELDFDVAVDEQLFVVGESFAVHSAADEFEPC